MRSHKSKLRLYSSLHREAKSHSCVMQHALDSHANLCATVYPMSLKRLTEMISLFSCVLVCSDKYSRSLDLCDQPSQLKSSILFGSLVNTDHNYCPMSMKMNGSEAD